jgi:hypothetical protein
MSHEQYWLSIAMFIGGQILLLTWVTVPSLKEKFRTANKDFSFWKWVRSDAHIIVGNLVFGAVFLIGIDEIIEWKPGIAKYIKFFYFLLGAFGTTIAQEKWSPTKKKLSNLIDLKTNIADAVTGGTTSASDTIAVAKEMGIDATKPPDKP